MIDSRRFDVDQLFEGSLRVLRAEAEYFSRLTDHDPELGRLNETHLVKLLRAYLPPKIGIGTGFIASGGSSGLQSPQCDIILFDQINNAPLYKSDSWSIYPIEMVYAVIEVKTTLNRGTLKDAFKKCAKIRAMAKEPNGKGNKAYIVWKPHGGPEPVAVYERRLEGLAPRFFVFGYNGWKRGGALERNFKDATRENEGAHIHGVCNLYDAGSLFVQHLAYRTGEEHFSRVEENGFRAFVLRLPRLLDSMLPVERFGFGFDLMDIEHYARWTSSTMLN